MFMVDPSPVHRFKWYCRNEGSSVDPDCTKFTDDTHLHINLVLTGDSLEPLVYYDVLQLSLLHTRSSVIQLAQYLRYSSIFSSK
ncbi:hypothetical protein T265_04826 [Opisthorchis viverrini]|uniref:Uncharacterized protein n=1 Tax=Opisthorchis viverrini TaxID=6198 RepID=A0A074ZLQ7_OPIVI|nr:hypothetical protein T265_04826 [Opisthorchis viverrini]KER28293.1 hypothetical protein T265_04826 [Opisthorchis viverrini]